MANVLPTGDGRRLPRCIRAVPRHPAHGSAAGRQDHSSSAPGEEGAPPRHAGRPRRSSAGADGPCVVSGAIRAAGSHRRDPVCPRVAATDQDDRRSATCEMLVLADGIEAVPSDAGDLRNPRRQGRHSVPPRILESRASAAEGRRRSVSADATDPEKAGGLGADVDAQATLHGHLDRILPRPRHKGSARSRPLLQLVPANVPPARREGLAQVGNEASFLRFLRACAARTGQILNLTDLARDADVAVNTAKAWLSVLQASFQVLLLQPYHRNVTKRLLKTPKLYFLDTGLCAYLTEWSSPETLESGAMSGAVLETYVVTEVLKSWWNRGKQPPLYFYRDKDGREIDLVLIQDGTAYPMEVKKSASPRGEWTQPFATLDRLEPGR